MKNKERYEMTKEIEKVSEKLFTERKNNDKIKEDYNPLSKDYNIYERGSGLYNMKEIVLRKTIFISEERYQKIKKEMSKESDYFSRRRTRKTDVILT